MSQDAKTDKLLVQYIASQVQDPQFETMFRQVCKQLESNDCELFFDDIKKNYQPKITKKNGRVIIVEENGRRRDRLSDLLPIILIATLGNRRRQNPYLFEETQRNNQLPLLLDAAPQLNVPLYQLFPPFNLTNAFNPFFPFPG